jgi:hypothetical protein
LFVCRSGQDGPDGHELISLPLLLLFSPFYYLCLLVVLVSALFSPFPSFPCPHSF